MHIYLKTKKNSQCCILQLSFYCSSCNPDPVFRKVQKRYTDRSDEYLKYPITFRVEMYENISLYSEENACYKQKVKWQRWPLQNLEILKRHFNSFICKWKRGCEEFFLNVCAFWFVFFSISSWLSSFALCPSLSSSSFISRKPDLKWSRMSPENEC